MLNHKNIVKDQQRISKSKPSINQCNWKEIHSSSHEKDWNNFESSNKSIALNVLFLSQIGKNIRQAFISKHNSMRENKVILLMITGGKE